MKDKEKQIEEMAKDIKHNGMLNACELFSNNQGCPFKNMHIECNDCKVAQYIFNKGYRKLPKDSVVLSKEEYKCLKQIEKSFDPFWFCSYGGCEGVCKECKDTCEMSIFVKERKETAEKIWLQAKTIVDKTKHLVQGREYLHIDALKEIVKSCGAKIVEIKEN